MNTKSILKKKFFKQYSINPQDWGPHAWFFLHSIAEGYPVKPTKEDKDNYLDFLLILGNILPCYHCRINYYKNLEKAGITKKKHFLNRNAFKIFIYKLHNIVTLEKNLSKVN